MQDEAYDVTFLLADGTLDHTQTTPLSLTNDMAHAGAVESRPTWLRIAYECDCGEEWQDEWSCACDSECPACGMTCEALDYDDCEMDDDTPAMAAAIRASNDRNVQPTT